MSFEAVPKKIQRWRQTIEEAACSHRKCTITNSGQPRMSDH